MGCDIHLIAEARDEAGAWQYVPGPIIDCWSCLGAGIVTRESNPNARPEWLDERLGKPCYWCSPVSAYTYDGDDETEIIDPFRNVQPGKVRDEWWSTRNYDVFGVLANVRNGTGFAGCVTSDGFDPISDCRGKPNDVSAEGLHWFELHGGEHSDTWVGLDEIMRYDWGRSVAKHGVVNLNEYRTFKANGRPDQWSGDVSGGSVQHVSNARMDELLSVAPLHQGAFNAPLIDGIRYYTRVSWRQPYGATLGAFVDRMEMLALTVGDRECRLVMDFDS